MTCQVDLMFNLLKCKHKLGIRWHKCRLLVDGIVKMVDPYTDHPKITLPTKVSRYYEVINKYNYTLQCYYVNNFRFIPMSR